MIPDRHWPTGRGGCCEYRATITAVRRGISILLALIFGMGPLSAALPGAEDVNLPACCRRNGAHHCAMAAQMAAMMAAEWAGKTTIGAPDTCPYYPGPSLALLMPAAHAVAAEAEAPPLFETTTMAVQPAQPASLSIPVHPHSGRGPPDNLPS